MTNNIFDILKFNPLLLFTLNPKVSYIKVFLFFFPLFEATLFCFTMNSSLYFCGNIFPDIEWLYNKNGELKKENFDACDSYVAFLGFLNKKRFGGLEFSSEIIGEANDGKGTREVNYIIRYWNKEDNRTTYIDVNK